MTTEKYENPPELDELDEKALDAAWALEPGPPPADELTLEQAEALERRIDELDPFYADALRRQLKKLRNA